VREVIFAPDSGAGIMIVLGLVLAGFGVLGVFAVLRRGEPVAPMAWAGFAFMILGGGGFCGWLYIEAKGVAVSPGRVEVLYRWPRPARVFDPREIAQVRIDYRGTKRPSPRLVIETRDGETLEGEGTSRSELVTLARSLIQDQMSSTTPTGQ
jgi:hypothetical protein